MDGLSMLALRQKKKLAKVPRQLEKLSKKHGVPVDDLKWLFVLNSIQQSAEMPVAVDIPKRGTVDVPEGCLEGYTLEETLGTGAFGVLKKGCRNSDCIYAIKVQYLPSAKDKEDFEKEAYLGRLFSLHGIGPQYLGDWKCPQVDLGLIATALWDGELPVDQLCVLKSELVAKLLSQVRAIHELGYVHADIFPKNILIKKMNGDIVDITVTDFGTVDSIEIWKQSTTDLLNFFQYYHQTALRRYLEDFKLAISTLRNSPQLLDYALLYLVQLCNEQLDPRIKEEILADINKYLPQKAEMKIGVPKLGEIEVEKECLKGYEIKEILGSGGTGVVVKACKEFSDDCKYAIKIRYLKYEADLAAVKEEIRLIQEFAKDNIGPRFYGAWTCADQQLALIVTELWDSELAEECQLDDEMVSKLLDQLDVIHAKGYVHLDVLPRNILVKNTNVTLSDFGSTRKFTDFAQDEIDLIYKYYTDPENNVEDFFLDNQIFKDDVRRDPRILDYAFLYTAAEECNFSQAIKDRIASKIS